MSTTRTIRLTCDRCGADVTHDDGEGHRPRDWERFALSNGARGLQLDGDLCPPCAVQVAEALRHPEAPPPAPPAPVRLGLTIEDRRIAVDLAEIAIRAAIDDAVVVFVESPTRLLDPNARDQVMQDQRAHAVTLVDRILAKMKELPHG